MEFPRRVYTGEEVQRAKELIDSGYKHQLAIKGSPDFERKVQRALELVKTAGYYDFLRTYIRSIMEIDGLTQLHEADAENRLHSMRWLARCPAWKQLLFSRVLYVRHQRGSHSKRTQF